MIKIEINNSYSKVSGLSLKQDKELRAILSYIPNKKASFYSGFGIRKKCMIDKYGCFPTGLLFRVLRFDFSSKPIVIDNRVKPLRIDSTVPDGAYKWQIEATLKTLEHARGTIVAPTGTGKSRVIKMICEKHGLKTLVIVPTLEIKKQLSQTLSGLSTVTVENIDSSKLKTMTNFDALIIDETHHAAAKTYHKLNKTAWNKIYYRWNLTATPFRNDTEETFLFEAIAGEVIYQLSYKEAVYKRYIVPVEAYFIEIPKQATNAFLYREVYNECIIDKLIRNQLLSILLVNLNACNKSTLCLVKEVRHGKILSEMTGLPFIYGENEESRDYIRQFNNGEIKTLIGTSGIISEGIDTKPCEYVIIAGLGKAKSQFMQAVGRSVRTSPGKESAKVIIISDTSHKFLSRHFRTQCAILKSEYGVVPYKLEVS
jgi:superfamily II DNA or RNA helicase